MKAFLLAAGLGSRLRPLTDHTPKCLLPIGGKPMLETWLRQLANAGVDEVFVNTHHLHEQVERFAEAWKSKPHLVLRHEPTLLGSAGTLRANRDFVKGEECFHVCYADNLTRYDVSKLDRLFAANKAGRPLAVMALFRSPEPWRCGIAEMDASGWIRKFDEKPPKPASNLANAGLYVFSREALEMLPDQTPSDIGTHFLPLLVPRLLGLEMDEPLVDIGTIESYERVKGGRF